VAVFASPNVEPLTTGPEDAGIQATRMLPFRTLDWGRFYVPTDAKPP